MGRGEKRGRGAESMWKVRLKVRLESQTQTEGPVYLQDGRVRTLWTVYPPIFFPRDGSGNKREGEL